MKKEKISFKKDNFASGRVLRFFIFTFLFSWIPWGVLVSFKISAQSPMGMLFVALGGIGPAVAAVTLLLRSREGVAVDYFRRLNPLALPVKWYLIIAAIPCFLLLFSVLVSTVWGGSLKQLLPLERFLENPFSLLSFAVFTLFFGPLTEEMGWRGFALDGLFSRYNGLVSSLIMACAWALWHTPLFFIEGYPLHEMSLGTAGLVRYFSDFFPKCVLYTWIFYRSGRSIWAAIFFHFMCNYLGMVIEIERMSEWIQVGLFYLVACYAVVANKHLFLPSPGVSR